MLVVFGCKGTRASVASSVRSLSLIQLAAIWWIPFQRGGGAAQLAFTAAGGRTHTHTHITTPITAMIVIHPNHFFFFFFFFSPSHLLSLGVHRALLLYDSLVTIVCVCVCVCVCICGVQTRKECAALFLLTVHAGDHTHSAPYCRRCQQLGRQIYSPGGTMGRKKECVWSPFKVGALPLRSACPPQPTDQAVIAFFPFFSFFFFTDFTDLCGGRGV